MERKAGNYEASRRFHASALGIQEEVLGADHRDVARLTYNLACIDARLGDRDGAMESLRRALERGFRWTGVGADEDLESLHGDPEFEAIVAEMSRRD